MSQEERIITTSEGYYFEYCLETDNGEKGQRITEKKKIGGHYPA